MISRENTTPDEAWQGFVGNQSPIEFLRHYQYADPESAVRQYVTDPAFSYNQNGEFSEEERETIIRLLARHIERNLDDACIMVHRSDSGAYNIPGAASVENWKDVVAEADSIERVSDLMGWGIWNAVYRVNISDGEVWYFVHDN